MRQSISVLHTNTKERSRQTQRRRTLGWFSWAQAEQAARRIGSGLMEGGGREAGGARATQGPLDKRSGSPLGVREARGCAGGAALVAPKSSGMREVGGPLGRAVGLGPGRSPWPLRGSDRSAGLGGAHTQGGPLS